MALTRPALRLPVPVLPLLLALSPACTSAPAVVDGSSTISCDWTMFPPIPGNGNPGPYRKTFAVEAAVDGTPMAWRLGTTRIARRYIRWVNPQPQRGIAAEASACDGQLLQFRGGSDQQLVVLGWESPFAIVEVGNVTTALGGSGEADGTRLQRWSVADAVWTPDTGAGTVNYTLPCADGSLARAAVVEQRAMEASGGWQRSIELQRRCPKVYHHMMVNIASDKPVLLRSQSRSVSEGT